MLEVKELFFQYPKAGGHVLRSISFSLERHQVLSIVGPSGSGKSTLLHLLAGLKKPTSGIILFEGQKLDNPEEQLIAGHDQIKLVFQDFKVMPNRTVEENIRYKLLHYEDDYQKERKEHLLQLCGLTPHRSKHPSTLSGGQQQRLALARTLADDPKLLLMDEPFSNLDPVTKEELFEQVMEIVQKESLGLILVSHDTRDVLRVTDKILFLSEGFTLQEATPREMYEKPQNELVARFLSPLNNVSTLLNQKNAFVRREHIRFSDTAQKGYGAKIIDSTFMGDRYLHRMTMENGLVLYGYSQTNFSSTNAQVHFYFDREKVLYFPSP